MKNKTKLEPKVSPKAKQKTILIFAAAGIAIATIVGIISFLSLNFGNQKEAFAVTYYNSSQSGNWETSSSWGGSTPPTTNVQTTQFVVSHYITRNGDLSFGKDVVLYVNSGATLEIIGDLSIGKDFNMSINGTLIIRGALNVDKDAALTVNGGGNLVVYGPASLGKSASFMVNGVMDFKDDLSFQKDAVVTVNGSGSINVGNDLIFDQGADVINNGTINVGHDIVFNSAPDQFNGSGAVNAGNNGCTYWTGTGSCNNNTVLPVELLSFEATASNNSVTIVWKTATELNNDYFTIERSSNGIEFEAIATVKGSGTTNMETTYDFEDFHPLNGLCYYRLKQTDFDGTTETFRPISVESAGLTANKMEIYPNPLLGSSFKLKMEQPEKGQLEIINQEGNRILSHDIDGNSKDEEITLPLNLLSGVYYVKVNTLSSNITFKLVKK